MAEQIHSVVVTKLSRVETVRYCPSEHGDVYSINILDNKQEINLIFSLEALIQLQQRINAALQHMITH